MGGISSGTTPYVYSVQKIDGGIHTEGWLQWEYNEAYASGGISLSYSGAVPSLSGAKDVGMFFRYIQDIRVDPQRPSVYIPIPNKDTLAHFVASGYPLMQLYVTTISGSPHTELAGGTAVSGVACRLEIIGY